MHVKAQLTLTTSFNPTLSQILVTHTCIVQFLKLILQIYHNFFFYLPTDGHSDYLHILFIAYI